MARIVIVGAGAVGQFYGAQLILAGHAVTFLARRDATALATQGLRLHQVATPQVRHSDQAFVHLPASAFHVATSAAGLPPPDWLLIALKTTALDDLPQLIGPLVGPRTRIAALCNGLGVEERIAALASPGQVFGVLCFVCINRDADGTVRHLAHGQLTVGHLREEVAETACLVDLWTGAGIACQAPSSLREARWRKLVWNIPYNGLGVVHDATTDRILGSQAWAAESRQLMRETIATANADLAAAGRAERIEDAWADEQEARTHEMGAYIPSTLMDARAGAPLEVEALFGEPLRRARRLGVPVPTLERLWAALAQR